MSFAQLETSHGCTECPGFRLPSHGARLDPRLFCFNGTSDIWNTSRVLQQDSQHRRSLPGSSSCCRMSSGWQVLRRRDKGGSSEHPDVQLSRRMRKASLEPTGKRWPRMNMLSAHKLYSCEVTQRKELHELVRPRWEGSQNNDHLIVALVSSHKRRSWDCVRLAWRKASSWMLTRVGKVSALAVPAPGALHRGGRHTPFVTLTGEPLVETATKWLT